MPLTHLITPKLRLLKPLVLINLLSLLSACSLWSTNNIQQTQSWQAKGKIGINSEQHKGSAWLDWQQQQDQYQIQLSGPLGFGSLRINGDGQKLDLHYKGQTYPALNSQQLYEITGLELPLQHFPFWAQGLISPYSPVVSSETIQQRLATLDQAGWQLEFSKYRHFGQQQLPSKIKLHNQQTKLTLIIKSWIYQ